VDEPSERPLSVVWDPRFLDYDFGPSHPFDMRSRGAAAELLEASLSPDERARLRWIRAVEPASAEELERFHDAEYLAWLRHASVLRRPVLLDRGDTPSFPGCYDASARIAEATSTAVARAVEDRGLWFVPAGGLHHARRDGASGFCVLNDVAVALAAPLAAGRRVAYVDLDAHHGDGVMYGYYGHGGLLDVDLHQDGRTLFPGTGDVGEIGDGDGAGRKVNLPLPPGSGDAWLLPLLRRVVLPLLAEFRPQLLVVQHGLDGQDGDPLARLRYTAHGYAEADRLLFDLARSARLPLVVTGGGGYRAESVSRGLAATGRRLGGLRSPGAADPLPPGWRQRFSDIFGREPPERWAEPSPSGPSPAPPPGVEALVHRLEAVLGRRFPATASAPSAAGEA